jgi:hypothetical protein
VANLGAGAVAADRRVPDQRLRPRARRRHARRRRLARGEGAGAVSWDALRAYPDYGDVELQRVIELAKLRVLPTTVSAADEAAQDPRVIDYIAKRVLVDNVLSAAISFWTNQTIAQSARGNTEEVVTYPDRIKAPPRVPSRATRDDLERQLPEVEKILGSVATQYDAPSVNTPGPMLTPGLDEYSPMPVTVPYWRRAGQRW